MNPGSLDQLTQEISDRFKQGLGARVEMPDGGMVFLTPGPLVDAPGLLITALGRGSMLWMAERPLTAFQLVSAGVKPLAVAEAIAHLANATYRHLVEERQLEVSRPTLRLEDGSKGSEDDTSDQT